MPTEADQIAALIPYRSDHLLMTVGGNTLPNAVAGPLLVKDNGTITLIYSDATFPYAERFLAPVLENRTAGRNVTIHLADEPVDEFYPGSIQRVVQNEIHKFQRGTIGLHYTGGTKAMSVHAFHTVFDLEEGDTVFSYLNPRDMTLVLETLTEIKAPHDINQVTMSLSEMLQVHGGTLTDSDATLVLLDVARAMVTWSCQRRRDGNFNDSSKFTSWKNAAVRPWSMASRPQPNEGWQARKNRVERELANQTTIPLTISEAECPREIAAALRRQLNFDGNNLPLDEAAQHFQASHPNHSRSAVYEWLDGKWLEHWALHHLQAITDEMGLHDVQINVEANFLNAANAGFNGSTGFEIDVTAMRGYQLFVFSCGVDWRQAKTKLFEAYTRARQMGGDEARVALITIANPTQVNRTVQEASELLMPTGQLKVFGRDDLLSLANGLQEWMRS